MATSGHFYDETRGKRRAAQPPTSSTVASFRQREYDLSSRGDVTELTQHLSTIINCLTSYLQSAQTYDGLPEFLSSVERRWMRSRMVNLVHPLRLKCQRHLESDTDTRRHATRLCQMIDEDIRPLYLRMRRQDQKARDALPEDLNERFTTS